MIEVHKDSQNDIPNTWNKLPLYELRNKKDRYGFTGGPFGSDLKSEHYTQQGVKILQLQNIGEGKFINKGISYTSEEKANELISCNIYPGEIILAKMAPVARCCKVPSTDERYVMCSDGIRLSVDIDRFSNEFVFQALNSKYFRKEAESKSTGTTRARIGLNELKLIPILIPNSLSEQQKIAEILSTVDDKIEIIDQQIIETRELKKGLMQRLLIKGIGHTEFKDSPLGIIPQSWEIVKQSEVATFYNGRAFKLTEWKKEGTPVIRLQNLTGTGKNYYYSDLNLPEHQYCYKGDLLYMWSATFGPVWWFGDKAIFHYHIWKIEHNSKFLDRNFHYYLLDNVTTRMKNESHGSTMLHVTKGGMEKLLIQLPPLKEQQKIAKILGTVDEKLTVLSEKKIHYQELKKGLMQQLLTGKIRVKV